MAGRATRAIPRRSSRAATTRSRCATRSGWGRSNRLRSTGCRPRTEGLTGAANVLELGCGRGGPGTREVARRHRVTGVDMSAVQIGSRGTTFPRPASFMRMRAIWRSQRALWTRSSRSSSSAMCPWRSRRAPDRPHRALARRRWPAARHVRRRRARGGRGRQLARRSDVLRVTRRRRVPAAPAGVRPRAPARRGRCAARARHGDIAFHWVLAQA